MLIIDIEENNTNYEWCKKCGGKCCKRNACDCSPKDFENDIKKMRKTLESGNYSIDFSREDVNSFFIGEREIVLLTEKTIKSKNEFFYIRPKNYGRPIVDIIHGEEDEGPCIFWNNEKGCPFSYKEKPTGGRTLIPFQELGTCIPQYTKELMRFEWKPLTEELVKLAKEFFDPTWELYKQFNFTIK